MDPFSTLLSKMSTVLLFFVILTTFSTTLTSGSAPSKGRGNGCRKIHNLEIELDHPDKEDCKAKMYVTKCMGQCKSHHFIRQKGGREFYRSRCSRCSPSKAKLVERTIEFECSDGSRVGEDIAMYRITKCNCRGFN